MGSNRTAELVGILGTYIKSPNLCCISLEYGHIMSYPLMMSTKNVFCTSSIIQKPYEIPRFPTVYLWEIAYPAVPAVPGSWKMGSGTLV